MAWLVDVEFRRSAVHGTGVFLRQSVKAGTRLWEVDAATRFSDCAALAAMPLERVAFALHGGYLHHPSDCLVWYEDGMEFMNHAPAGLANAGLCHWPSMDRDHTAALRDIKAGEELFEDYGFWADVGFADGHWLEPFYQAALPHHLTFLRSLVPELLAA